MAGEKLLMGLRRAALQPPCNKRSSLRCSEPERDSATPLPATKGRLLGFLCSYRMCVLISWWPDTEIVGVGKAAGSEAVRAFREELAAQAAACETRRVPATAFPRSSSQLQPSFIPQILKQRA